MKKKIFSFYMKAVLVIGSPIILCSVIKTFGLKNIGSDYKYLWNHTSDMYGVVFGGTRG